MKFFQGYFFSKFYLFFKIFISSFRKIDHFITKQNKTYDFERLRKCIILFYSLFLTIWISERMVLSRRGSRIKLPHFSFIPSLLKIELDKSTYIKLHNSTFKKKICRHFSVVTQWVWPAVPLCVVAGGKWSRKRRFLAEYSEVGNAPGFSFATDGGIFVACWSISS